MKRLKAFWRFINDPATELWWSGVFLCQLAYQIDRFPKDPTNWQIAMLCATATCAVITTCGAFGYLRKVRP